MSYGQMSLIQTLFLRYEVERENKIDDFTIFLTATLYFFTLKTFQEFPQMFQN